MSNPLSSKAEDLRQEIKALVAQATLKLKKSEEVVAQATTKSETPEQDQPASFTENVDGDKIYEGKLFEEKVSRLMNELALGKVWIGGISFNIPNVCLTRLQGWGWGLAYLSHSRPIANKFSYMYLISLSEGASINPGGNLVEGTSHFVTDKAILSSDSTTIFVIPLKKESINVPMSHGN